MLISLRGTNGSGKSTVIRNILAECAHKPVFGALGLRLPEAYRLDVVKVKKPVYLLGPYVSVCGGCDRLIPFDLIPRLITKYSEKGHVIFEGVIVGSIYGQVGQLMEKFGKDAVMVFLDTSLEECIRRVKSRRADRSDARPFNPKNLTTKFTSVQRVRDRALGDKILRVETVASDEAHTLIYKLLRGAR